MDWIYNLNKAIAYMEENMVEEMDYVQLAKIAGCSSFHFQRMFSYIAGVSLTQYIKRRKMSLAAVDLQNGAKIVDTAFKYGYSSPTAFNRAFQSIHGFAPSRAKESGVSIKSYPLINFKLIAKGAGEMEYRIEKHDAIRVVGVSAPLNKDVEKAYEEGTALWAKVLFEDIREDLNGFSNGKICGELNAAGNFVSPDGSLPKYNGFFGIETEHDSGGEYMIAVASPMPENDSLKEYIIPAHTWAIFSGKHFFEDEDSAESFIKYEERVYSEWLPSSGYEIADSISVQFLLATTDLENAPFEIWLPVKNDNDITLAYKGT